MFNHGIKVSIITKGIASDKIITLLTQFSHLVKVSVSIGINDDEKARAIEVNAPSPTERFAFVKKLASHGIEVIVRMDPLIPGYSDNDEMLLDAVNKAAQCNASGLIASYLYLSHGIKMAMKKNGYEQFINTVDRHYGALESLGGMGKKNYVFLTRRKEKYSLIENACAFVNLPFTICKCCNYDIECNSCGSIGNSRKLKDIEDIK